MHSGEGKGGEGELYQGGHNTIIHTPSTYDRRVRVCRS